MSKPLPGYDALDSLLKIINPARFNYFSEVHEHDVDPADYPRARDLFDEVRSNLTARQVHDYIITNYQS